MLKVKHLKAEVIDLLDTMFPPVKSKKFAQFQFVCERRTFMVFPFNKNIFRNVSNI